jgi:hypothetical protein
MQELRQLGRTVGGGPVHWNIPQTPLRLGKFAIKATCTIRCCVSLRWDTPSKLITTYATRLAGWASWAAHHNSWQQRHGLDRIDMFWIVLH